MLAKHRGAVKEQFSEMFEEIKSIARKGYTMFRLASGDVQAEWDVEDIDRQIESSDFAAFDGQKSLQEISQSWEKRRLKSRLELCSA